MASYLGRVLSPWTVLFGLCSVSSLFLLPCPWFVLLLFCNLRGVFSTLSFSLACCLCCLPLFNQQYPLLVIFFHYRLCVCRCWCGWSIVILWRTCLIHCFPLSLCAGWRLLYFEFCSHTQTLKLLLSWLFWRSWAAGQLRGECLRCRCFKELLYAYECFPSKIRSVNYEIWECAKIPIWVPVILSSFHGMYGSCILLNNNYRYL